MSSDRSADAARSSNPPTTAHKLIGTLNVLFASVMMLCGACSGASLVMQVVMAPVTEDFQKQMQETIKVQAEKEHQAKIDDLKAQESAATAADEKARLTVEREKVEQSPPPELPMADMMSAYREPRLIGYLIADMSTGVLINIFLFASGIGLLASKGWARRMGVWVAAIKIVRLVAVYGFFLIFVVPMFSQKMGQMMEQVAVQAQQRQQQQGGPPMPQMGQSIATIYGIMMSSTAVGMMIFGSIYPVIMLWVLTRPKVKLACGESAHDLRAELL